MADADDYESLPMSAPMSVVVTAGAVAGIAEHCAMFPVDSVKTRMQSLACDRQQMGITKQLVTMVKEEGMFRPIRGVSAMMAGAGPAHAMYFGVLETGKHMATRSNVPLHFGDGIAAVFATTLHDGVMTPAEVVKQRMQMCCSPFTSTLQCCRHVYKSEGLRAFYRSYPTALSMNIPFHLSMVVTYGLVQRSTNPTKEYKPEAHFLAGAVAGTVASAVTMPLDVCKTLLNTQEAGVLKAMGTQEVRGFFNAAKTVVAMGGPLGFFQGLTPRILYQAPSTAIAWSVYEFFKYYLKDRFDTGGGDSKMDTYETLSSVRSSSSSASTVRPGSGQVGPRVGHLSPSASSTSGDSDLDKEVVARGPFGATVVAASTSL